MAIKRRVEQFLYFIFVIGKRHSRRNIQTNRTNLSLTGQFQFYTPVQNFGIVEPLFFASIYGRNSHRSDDVFPQSVVIFHLTGKCIFKEREIHPDISRIGLFPTQ